MEWVCQKVLKEIKELDIFIGSIGMSDLECVGSFIWESVRSGAIINCNFTLYNIGEPHSKLNWEISESCDWLTVSPASGSSASEPNDVTISVDITGVPWGFYECELTISDPCAMNSPQLVNVTLDITGPIIELSSSDFTFYADEDGQNPPDQIFTIKQTIENFGEEYEVISAESGIQCLDMLKNNKNPDIILLDIMMTDMSGWEVLKKLKENPSWEKIPIIFLTARTDRVAEEAGGFLAEDYIEKPFKVVELKERIDKILNKI